MSWKIDNIDFADYGVYVSKSSGVLDLPNIVDNSHDWIDLNGKEFWQNQSDIKYQDREIILSCWILATGYEDFKTKVSTFFTALIDIDEIPLLSTPFGNDIAVSLIDSVQVVRRSQYNQSIQAGQFTLRLTVFGDLQLSLITVYRSDGVVRAYTYYGSDAKISKSLQGISEITFTAEFSTMQAFDQDDYIMYENEKYISFEFPQVDKYSTNKYVYRLTFVNQFFVLKDVQFRVTDSSDFYWWANMDNVVDKVIENANRGYPGLFLKGTVDATEYRNHQFQNENCYDVINQIAGVYELEFEFRWNSGSSQIQINVKSAIGVPAEYDIQYGKGNGLYKINRISTGRELMVTALYAYGSEKNIPAGYGFPRLKLATEPVTGYYLGKHIEKTKVWDDIFPHRTGTVTSYTFTPDAVNIENSKYDLYDEYMFNLKDGYPDSSIYLNGETPAKVHFNSGQLAGFEFEVNDFTFGAVTGGTFHLTPVREVPDIMYPHAAGDPVGSAQMEPVAGDEYVLLDINLPQSYIDAAEAELQAAADAYITDFKTPKPTYTVETDPSYINSALFPGDTISLIDTDFGLSSVTVRIVDIVTNLYLGGSVITLASYVAKSKRQILTEKVKAIERSISNAKLDTVEVIKGEQQTTLALKNAIINPLDEKIHIEKLRRKRIDFVATATPAITDYSIYRDIFKENVQADLYFVNTNGNKAKHSAPAEFVLNGDGLIESINFGDLGEQLTGFILLQ